MREGEQTPKNKSQEVWGPAWNFGGQFVAVQGLQSIVKNCY